MLKPDYESGSIVNLMSSIGLGLGGRPGPYASLPQLPVAEVAASGNVVLLMLDGLGYNYLMGRSGTLAQHLRGRLTSLFPSGTAAVVTSFLTGVAPQQHAVTGWFMYLKDLGTVAAILPFRPRWGGDTFAVAGIGADRIVTTPPIFRDLQAHSYFMIHHSLVDSAYTRALTGNASRVGYHDLPDYLDSIASIIRSRPERKYVYAYWSQIDALSHKHGVASAEVEAHFRALDAGVLALIDSLRGTGTLLLATADHGLIDTGSGFINHIADHPELAQCLALPLCGEPRVAYCYVRSGYATRFERYVGDILDDRCECYARDDFVRAGWFGLGEPNPKLYERIGDYILVMKDRHVLLDALAADGPFDHIGVHGGTSEDEMYVPLVVVQC